MYNMHTARRAQGALPTASNGRPAWIPNDPNGTRPKLDETLGHDDEAIMRRNTLAQTAQERYDVWAATTDAPELEELSIHPSRHTFRGRDVGKELHGSGSRMVFRAFNSEQERVVAAAREHSSSSLKQPVYSNWAVRCAINRRRSGKESWMPSASKQCWTYWTNIRLKWLVPK
ncbi:hypothetical protein T492DRAFT_474981 [Pavlovales sp. CCMP2436]|nr:hypothetical protein T492DRAFT_474981 [Pavlovales sp. CCMP2436]